jgi:MtN3 and saliva related transmembrane protein
MKEIVAVIFGLGLGCNALLFVPQVIAVWRKKSDEGISLITFGGFSVLQAIGIVHGVYQRDWSLILGMAASLMTCGSVTGLTVDAKNAFISGDFGSFDGFGLSEPMHY